MPALPCAHRSVRVYPYGFVLAVVSCLRIPVVAVLAILWTGTVGCHRASTSSSDAPEDNAGEPTPKPTGVGAMVKIPGGTFRMGSDDGRPIERPAHDVKVAAFEMDVTEVTVAAYLKCVDGGRCFAPATRNWCNGTGQPNHPVNCVRWNEAKVYCEWVGKRLPTEEEWEFAAKGTDGRQYPWGNEEPGGRPCWDRMDGTCEVGTHSQANGPFGLADMAGNVWEWTSSASTPDYATPKRTDSVILRGGGWRDDDPSYLRAGYRAGTPPTHSSADLGFRCAR